MSAIIGSTDGAHVFHLGLVLTAMGFGFRHGIDWDHIAALTDITSSQDHPRRSMLLATMYASGHALVVAVLGFAAIVLAARLPRSIDTTMERVVGATLIALGIYVFYGLLRRRRAFRMRSRWMLIFAGVRKARRWFRDRRRAGLPVEIVLEHPDRELLERKSHESALARAHQDAARSVRGARPRTLVAETVSPPAADRGHRHLHPAAGMPDDPFVDYVPRTAFGIGMIHGVGAETPTQILIFVTAAGTGGKAVGVLLLAAFLVGLVASNTLVALAGTFGFIGATRNFKLYVGVSLLTAVFSLVVGFAFLVGSTTWLPTLLGG